MKNTAGQSPYRPAALLGRRGLPLLLAALLFSWGCGSKTIVVTIPPKVDLQTYKVIGVIEFGAEGEDVLRQDATQKFLQSLQAAQQGVLLLELGSEKDVLRSVGAETLDAPAIRAIAAKNGVDAVLTGLLKVSEAKPELQLGRDFKSLSAKASVDGGLSAKIRESRSGATLWTNSASGKWSVASLNITDRGASSFGLSDPQAKYDKMVTALVNAVTEDFWPTYQRRRVDE